MSYQLPENFFFGGAMSGPQTEGKWQDGGKLPNLWDTWSNLDIHAFHNRVGSYAGNDFNRKNGRRSSASQVSWHGFHSHFYSVGAVC